MAGFRRAREQPGPPRRRRTGVVTVATALGLGAAVLIAPAPLTSSAPARPALTTPALTSPIHSRPVGAVTSQDAALVARARVDALLQRYQDAQAQVDVAVAALSAAFGAEADAETDSTEATAQARRAAVVQAQQVRAVYATGGPVSLSASVLSATSADDALWRVSTADRVLAGLFTRSRAEVSTRADLAVLARRRTHAADDAAQAQAQALIVLQKQAAVAEQALTRAQQTLAALNAKAQKAQAARQAARQIAAAKAAAEKARRTAMGPVRALGIPAEYLAAYQAAAPTCPGLPWTLLAAVGQIESGHGRNNGPSSAGAVGPMQFMPSTFARYAVDGDHNGTLDAWDPQDAIFTAAHYLCVSGAKGGSAAGIQAALLAYNHAQWYVDLVLAAEQSIIAKQTTLAAAQR